jgi:hypothetical protein
MVRENSAEVRTIREACCLLMVIITLDGVTLAVGNSVAERLAVQAVMSPTGTTSVRAKALANALIRVMTQCCMITSGMELFPDEGRSWTSQRDFARSSAPYNDWLSIVTAGQIHFVAFNKIAPIAGRGFDSNFLQTLRWTPWYMLKPSDPMLDSSRSARRYRAR